MVSSLTSWSFVSELASVLGQSVGLEVSRAEPEWRVGRGLDAEKLGHHLPLLSGNAVDGEAQVLLEYLLEAVAAAWIVAFTGHFESKEEKRIRRNSLSQNKH